MSPETTLEVIKELKKEAVGYQRLILSIFVLTVATASVPLLRDLYFSIKMGSSTEIMEEATKSLHHKGKSYDGASTRDVGVQFPINQAAYSKFPRNRRI